jgi:uncharacterized protein YdeI (YjbR/CyaY-like superfamily)
MTIYIALSYHGNHVQTDTATTLITFSSLKMNPRPIIKIRVRITNINSITNSKHLK